MRLRHSAFMRRPVAQNRRFIRGIMAETFDEFFSPIGHARSAVNFIDENLRRLVRLSEDQCILTLDSGSGRIAQDLKPCAEGRAGLFASLKHVPRT